MSTLLTYPLEATYGHVKELLKSSTQLLLGVGQSTSWPVESAPPIPNVTTTEVNELNIYIAPTLRLPAIRTELLTPDGIELAGKYYELKDPYTESDITLSNIQQVYLEFELEHNLLTISSFRTVGLYKFPTFAEGVDIEQSSFTPTDVESASLYYIENFQPVVKVDNTTQILKVIVNA